MDPHLTAPLFLPLVNSIKRFHAWQMEMRDAGVEGVWRGNNGQDWDKEEWGIGRWEGGGWEEEELIHL